MIWWIRVLFLVGVLCITSTQACSDNYKLSDQTWKMIKAFGDKINAQQYAIYFDSSVRWHSLFEGRKQLRASDMAVSINDYPNYQLQETKKTVLHIVLGEWTAFLSKHMVHALNDRNDYWLIASNSVDNQFLKNCFANVSFSYDSLSFVFGPLQDEESIELKEVYRIHETKKELEMLDYGNWTLDKGLWVTPVQIWDRRSDLKGHKFRIAANFNPPYITMVAQNCTNASCFQGMYPDVWHSLQSVINFTYDLSPPPDGAWGNKLDDGTWNGMIGQLVRNEIDIAPAEFTITAMRSEVVDFNMPIAESHQKFFVKNPSEAPNWTAFLDPLSPKCWVIIATFIFTIPFLLTLAVSVTGDENRSDFTLPQSFCFVAGAMTIARGCVMLGGSLIFWHWEAMIISFLAVRTTILPFKNIEELVTKTNFKVVVQPGTSYVDTFKFSSTSLLQTIYSERIEPNLDTYPTVKSELSELIKANPDMVLFDNYFTTINYEPFKACEIVAIPVAYFPVQFAYAFQKKSPYFELFWYQMNKMKERGTVGKILKKYEAESQICPDYSGKPLGFSQCFTAFIFLLIGMGVGLVLLVMEYFATRFSFTSRAAESIKRISTRAPAAPVTTTLTQHYPPFMYSNGVFRY